MLMKLYKRDYCYLTLEETELWETLKEKEVVHRSRNGKMEVRKSLYRQYPVAARHYISLFPNNHLDIEDLKKEDLLNDLITQFEEELNEIGANERVILNWIKENSAYFIIASMLKSEYNFGHHDTFIFPEFQLGNSFQIDYLLVGKNSGGYEFVFVELEHPTKNITLNDGHFGDAFRKGERQTLDWKGWLESNYNSISETFMKYKSPLASLPMEFLKYDSSRIHYAVIAGRRTEFKEKTYQLKRQKRKIDDVLFLHYDSLSDYSRNLIGKMTY